MCNSNKAITHSLTLNRNLYTAVGGEHCLGTDSGHEMRDGYKLCWEGILEPF